MATENKRLNVNPILWSTADKTFVPASGEIWYYYETAGSILSVVGDGSSTVQDLRDGAYINQVDNLGLSSGRTAFQELTSGTLSTIGWYTIAEAEASAVNSAISEIRVVANSGRGKSCRVAFRPSVSTRTSANSTIKLLDDPSDVIPSTSLGGFRIAKSDSVDSGGFKVQIKVLTSITINTIILGNIGRLTGKGLVLVTPYLDDTPTLPDGSTTATFIEAGAELRFVSQMYSGAQIRKVSSDILYISVPWGQIPKQGTTIEFDFPTTFAFTNSGGTASLTSSDTYATSNLVIVGEQVTFFLTTSGGSAGKWATLGADVVVMFPTGGDGGLTIA